jgi:hypothetical protein
MQPVTIRRGLMCLAGMAIAALASGAAPLATLELEEISVEGTRERNRKRAPDLDVGLQSEIVVQHEGLARFVVQIFMKDGELPLEFSFRRSSNARQRVLRGGTLRPAFDQPIPLLKRVQATDPPRFLLQSNVDEADGLPASIPFGPQASLVNVDYLRLRDVQGASGIKLPVAIHPQTRRCEAFRVLDDGKDNPKRFVLLADSNVACRRIERSREGDLIFADSVPEPMRQAVRDAYEPIAVSAANRLGSESGLVFVALWADSPHKGFRLEQSWNRNSLLLFNGMAWQQGAVTDQQEALREAFMADQIERRFRQTDAPGMFTMAANRYLLGLFTADQARDVRGWLVEALPGWIAGCTVDLRNPARIAAAQGSISSIDCGMVLQFVYDAVARANPAKRASLYDTWRLLLGEAYRRGESGAKQATFLASSEQARRIAQGLLDGSVDWTRFAVDLGELGVRLRVDQTAPRPVVSVLALTHFDD